jgi:hypothetical protein
MAALVGMLSGQVIDSFSDGDFTTGPAWSGDTGSWQIVTNASSGPNVSNSYTLRLNHTVSEGGTRYLSTQRTASWGTEQSWGFWWGRRSGAAATSGNYSVVWLWASESDLTAATVDGYRVQFGDSSGNDEIRLQRVDNGSVTTILTSSGAVTNGLEDIGFLVRVTRTSGSEWTLYTSTLPTANGTDAGADEIPSAANTTVNQGSVTDNTYTDFSNGYFGFMAVHTSGADARTGAEFDQLYFDTNSDASLPVELSFFTALSDAGRVLLAWRTESEIDNLGFLLYRRESGAPFILLADYRTDPRLRGQGSTTRRTDYAYTDDQVRIGATYQYQLADVDFTGRVTRHEIRTVTVKGAGVRWDPARPNPFNPFTTVTLRVGDPGRVTIRAYDLTGKEVATLLDRNLTAGTYQVRWDGRATEGSRLPSGVYLLRLKAGRTTAWQKVILVR